MPCYNDATCYRVFEGINVPRKRFRPVKTTSDLLIMMSNLTSLKGGIIDMNTKRSFPSVPLVKLGNCFKKVLDLFRCSLLSSSFSQFFLSSRVAGMTDDLPIPCRSAHILPPYQSSTFHVSSLHRFSVVLSSFPWYIHPQHFP